MKFTKERFASFRDKRADNKQYSIGDAAQSALAMFSLKDSSTLDFNNKITQREKNLQRIYHIENFAPDGQVREILDGVAPVQFEKVKRAVFKQV